MFKNIKKLSLIIAAIMLATSLSSCAANTNIPDTTSNTTGNTTQQSASAFIDTPTTPAVEYEALAYGFTDSVTGINAKIEYDRNEFANKYYIDERPAMYPMTYAGKQYQGEYADTMTSTACEMVQHRYTYTSAENSLLIKYNVDASTGAPTYWFISDKNYIKNSQGKKQFSEEECLNIALKFIKAKNIDMEHLKLDEAIYYTSRDGTYLFKFRHYVGDVRLGNSIRIYVTVYGDIVAYNEAIIFDVDELIESKIIESIDYKAAEEALKIKTDEIFGTGEATSLYEYEYLHSTKTLARVNGKYILSCQTYVDVTYKNNGSNVPGYSFISVIFLE
jgi:hypothetical protein